MNLFELLLRFCIKPETFGGAGCRESYVRCCWMGELELRCFSEATVNWITVGNWFSLSLSHLALAVLQLYFVMSCFYVQSHIIKL